MTADESLLPLDAARYLDTVRTDGARLRGLGQRLDPTTPVPGCPSWRVGDVVRHVASVYLRQSAAIAAGRLVPPGDPVGAAAPGEDDVAYLDRGITRILAAIDRPADTTCWTWSQPQGRLAFWQRRMAHETVIHRVDLEQAAGEKSEVADDVALDGMDEVLTVFLPLSLPSDGAGFGIEPDLHASVVVASAGASWTVAVRGTHADVHAGGSEAAASVSGEPPELLLWLWGRGREEALAVEGDRAHVAALRRALAAATQ